MWLWLTIGIYTSGFIATLSFHALYHYVFLQEETPWFAIKRSLAWKLAA